MPLKRRIFVAILISPKLQKEIITWENQWQSASRKMPVRWLAEKNLHLTLIPPWYEDDIDQITKILKTFSGKTVPYEIKFDKVTFGPDPSIPRLIWAEGKTPPEIINLKSQLEKILLKQPEKRPFLLHLTLARFRPEMFSIFPIKKLDESVSWNDNINSFALMESHLSPKGAEYSILEKFRF